MSTEEYEVEKLLAHQPCKRFPGTIEYHIKWRGFSNEENTWERESNVFAKHLIDAYWNTQKISRNEYLKSIKNKRKSSDNTKNAVTTTKKKTKKEYAQESSREYSSLSSVDMSVQPEEGLEWTDLKKIISVFHSEKIGLFSEVKWSNSSTSLIPNIIIREYRPSVLIQYYETLLEFRT